ncbi:MAG: rhomboid family intramembrane serine protease [Hyphomicrobiaceae bacterium]|nr:rhomboid family intramembrane serine protease [Hyphomicrobiaceae bacterium]
MFVPLSDDNPLRSIRFPVVTVALIVINVVVFLLELTPAGQHVAASFAIVPSELFRVGVVGGAAHGPLDAMAVPEGLTLLTYMFLHGDPIHLLGNMMFLWVFGDNVEDAMGHARFVLFYLVCGVVGGLAHAVSAEYGAAALLMKSSSAAQLAGQVPLIGASAAVAGSIAAYLMLHPHVRVWVLAFRFIPLRITALFALGAWIATQFVMLMVPDVGPVAWWAHVGGIVAGAILVVFMRRTGVPLFDRPVPRLAA